MQRSGLYGSLMFILSTTLCTVVWAQNLPCNTYGGLLDERCYALTPATGGGWVLGGWTRSYGIGAPAFKNALIVRTYADGIPAVALVSQAPFDEEIRSADRTADSGYVLCGWTRSPTIGRPGTADILVVKLNAQCIPQWVFVYGDTLGDEIGYSVVADPMGLGCTVVGSTTSPNWGPPPQPNIIVLKLNALGFPSWTRVLWNPLRPLAEEALGVTRTPPMPPGFASYAVVGRWAEPGLDTLWDGFVLRLDSEGFVVAPGVRTFPGPNTEEAWSVVPVPLAPLDYTVAGWTSSWGSGAPRANLWLVRLSDMGNPTVWNRCYCWPEDDEKLGSDRSLVATPDGYAMCGWTKSRGPNAPPNTNFVVLKLDTAGRTQWVRTHPSLPGANDEQAYPMVHEPSGRYAIAGYTASFGVGGEDFHLMTMNALGWRPACVDSWPIDRESIPVAKDTIVARTAEPLVGVLPFTDTIVWSVEVCPLVGIKDEGSSPNDPAGTKILSGPCPEVQLIVPVRSFNTMLLRDAAGRQVAVLAKGWFDCGRYSVAVPSSVAPGVYYVDVVARGRRVVVKVLRL